MLRSLFVCLFIAISAPVFAAVQCTSEPKEKWLSEAKMKQMIADLGLTIAVFKVTSGNCYEIYGRDKNNRRIEIYFNPLDGKIVKQDTL